MTSAAIDGYLGWLRRSALPVWSTRGFDAAGERFHERLDLSGAPLDVPHRAMVQARQIYVFAHAALAGWHPDGADLARSALRTLRRHALDESAGEASFAFSVGADGRVVSDARDSYTHAFILFALSWLYRLDGDPTHLALADKVLAFFRRFEDADHGGVYDLLPLQGREKRQNPLMHLLEALLMLEQAAPGRGYVDRAAEIMALFRRRMFREPGILLEHFAEDWRAHPDAGRADVFEPGHHYEWIWLLDLGDRLSGTDHRGEAEQLFRTAWEAGFAADGAIHDEVGADLRVRKSSTRLWPHTEAIKAAMVRRAAGDPRGGELADRMCGVLGALFLDRAFAGGWIDHLDAARRPLVDYVPASSLYHLFLAGTEAGRAADVPAESGS